MTDEIMKIDTASGYIAKARLAREKNDTAAIEGLYLKAVEADPKNVDARTALMNLYSTQQKFEACEKQARELVTLHPDRIIGYLGLATAYAGLGRWPDLDALLAEAERRVPDDLGPYMRAAFPLLNAGKDLPRAERYYRKYLSQEPEPSGATHAMAHWRLGLTLEKMGKRQDAVASLRTAVKLDPNLEGARKDLKRLAS
jgi:tetratricopeptide (TPR) repeat protein